MEEDVVEGHRNLLENFPKWHQTILKLMELPDQLDFDIEGWPFNLWLLLFYWNTILYFISAYVLRMSNVLTEFGDDILSLKTKFTEARKELQVGDVDSHRPKLLRHPRSHADTESQQAERCEWWILLLDNNEKN